jgi:hypothetical protein
MSVGVMEDYKLRDLHASHTVVELEYLKINFEVYYESIKREPKIRGINKCRCDERLIIWTQLQSDFNSFFSIFFPPYVTTRPSLRHRSRPLVTLHVSHLHGGELRRGSPDVVRKMLMRSRGATQEG